MENMPSLSELRKLAKECNEAIQKQYEYLDLESPVHLSPGAIAAIMPILHKASIAKRPAKIEEAAMNPKNA